MVHTGAEVMSLVNSDENKTFGVVLRTPVENSKGIPHILEHSVLCGSRKYPIKVNFWSPQRVCLRGGHARFQSVRSLQYICGADNVVRMPLLISRQNVALDLTPGERRSRLWSS